MDYEELKEKTECIRDYLQKNPKYKFEELPELPKKEEINGEAVAIAYPIIGIEKYHGMYDQKLRIAYFPSVSVNYDALKTITLVKFDQSIEKDLVIIGGEEKTGRERERVLQMVSEFRKNNGVKTKVIVISKNVFNFYGIGKGLGTSASAGAALAKALIAAYDFQASNNSRLVSIYARLLAGSASRSAVGGISVWFSYPNLRPEDSYSIRIDKNCLDLKIVAVPIPLKLKTEYVHKDVITSPFFESWTREKPKKVFELIKAVENKDLAKIGKIAEEDTRRLHAVAMTGQNGIVAWEPETIKLMQQSKEFKENDIPAYYSIDTGPSVFFITNNKYAKEVKESAEEVLKGKYPVLISEVAGEAEIAREKEKEELLIQAKPILEKYGITDII
ncbi:MAG: diphosphomevalonate/mevalonate 3,5-bisphosphate decarboxylase family protein [Methanosarcinales archaeon]